MPQHLLADFELLDALSPAESAAQQQCLQLRLACQYTALQQQAQAVLQRYPKSLRSVIVMANLVRSHAPQLAVQWLAPHWHQLRTRFEKQARDQAATAASFTPQQAEWLEACAVEYARNLNLIGETSAALTVLEFAVRHFAPLRKTSLQQQYDEGLQRPLDTFPTLGELPQPLALSHWELATLLLGLGQWEAGFKAYEARLWWWQQRGWHSPELQALRQRPWRGLAQQPDLRGKRMLIMGEQGYGDQMMFWRFLPRLKALGAVIYLGVNSALKRLALLSLGEVVDDVLALGDAIPACDYYLPLCSLPHALGLTQDAELALTPWRVRMEGRPPRPLRVGICFAGKASMSNNAQRSISWDILQSWLHPVQAEWGEAVHWLRIQPGWAGAPTPGLHAEDQAVQDFLDLGVLLLSLDLLISVDSAPVHLAGCLQIPTLMLDRAIGHLPDWRWGLHQLRPQVWYPKLQIARQTTPDDWSGPLALAAAAVQVRLRQTTPR